MLALETSTDLFIAASESDLTVEIDDTLIFSANDHITSGIGTKLVKVELLDLQDFAFFSNGEVTIMPKETALPGDYPLIVRVTDKQSRPHEKQYIIKVAGREIEQTQAEEKPIEIASSQNFDEIETELDENAVCDKACKLAQLERAKENLVTEMTIEVGGIEIDINLEQLTGESDGEKSEIESIMESVEDLPAEVQTAVFSAVLQGNSKYKEQ